MIVINLWIEAGESVQTGANIDLLAVTNDMFDLQNDPDLIEHEIYESDYHFKTETVYEIVLDRATIDADPVPEPALEISYIRELKQSEPGHWQYGPIRK